MRLDECYRLIRTLHEMERSPSMSEDHPNLLDRYWDALKRYPIMMSHAERLYLRNLDRIAASIHAMQGVPVLDELERATSRVLDPVNPASHASIDIDSIKERCRQRGLDVEFLCSHLVNRAVEVGLVSRREDHPPFMATELAPLVDTVNEFLVALAR